MQKKKILTFFFSHTPDSTRLTSAEVLACNRQLLLCDTFLTDIVSGEANSDDSENQHK